MRTVSRRQFVQGVSMAGLGLVAGCGRWPWQAPLGAQQGSGYRIGYLHPGPAAAIVTAEPFREALRDLGYSEGQNLVIDFRWAEGRMERLAELAADLASLPVDVIVATGTPEKVAGIPASHTGKYLKDYLNGAA